MTARCGCSGRDCKAKASDQCIGYDYECDNKVCDDCSNEVRASLGSLVAGVKGPICPDCSKIWKECGPLSSTDSSSPSSPSSSSSSSSSLSSSSSSSASSSLSWPAASTASGSESSSSSESSTYSSGTKRRRESTPKEKTTKTTKATTKRVKASEVVEREMAGLKKRLDDQSAMFLTVLRSLDRLVACMETKIAHPGPSPTTVSLPTPQSPPIQYHFHYGTDATSFTAPQLLSHAGMQADLLPFHRLFTRFQ